MNFKKIGALATITALSGILCSMSAFAAEPAATEKLPISTIPLENIQPLPAGMESNALYLSLFTPKEGISDQAVIAFATDDSSVNAIAEEGITAEKAEITVTTFDGSETVSPGGTAPMQQYRIEKDENGEWVCVNPEDGSIAPIKINLNTEQTAD